jgi:hypothetical protein
MKPHLILMLISFLTSPVAVCAQFRPAKCEVQPLYIGPGGIRSSNFGLMGTFATDDDDTVRSFKLQDTNLIATVAIAYDFDYSKYKLHRIRLAIGVSDTEQKELFESIGTSEARTQYRKGWNLAVTKNVTFDKLLYMITLRCWDSGGKRPFL